MCQSYEKTFRFPSLIAKIYYICDVKCTLRT